MPITIRSYSTTISFTGGAVSGAARQIPLRYLKQNLIRARLGKFARKGMFRHPGPGYAVLPAQTMACGVDSNFTNSQLEALALHVSHFRGSAGTFLSAPTTTGTIPDGAAWLRPARRQ